MIDNFRHQLMEALQKFCQTIGSEMFSIGVIHERIQRINRQQLESTTQKVMHVIWGNKAHCHCPSVCLPVALPYHQAGIIGGMHTPVTIVHSQGPVNKFNP